MGTDQDLPYGDTSNVIGSRGSHPGEGGANVASVSPLTYSVATPAGVQALKATLVELGFNVFFDDDGGVVTAWLRHALREFQIYAKLPRAARVKADAENAPRWLDRLEAVDNANPYGGEIDGTLNQATQARLEFWQQNKLRCPVVAEIYVNTGAKVWPALELVTGDGGPRGNYWRYDDLRIRKYVDAQVKDRANRYDRLQVRICDLTGFFEGSHATDSAALVKSGRLKLHGGWVGGMLSDSRVMGTKAEILPETLMGRTWGELQTDAQRRTFRVVRAVSEFECFGYFQALNGYDDAWISLGPCHWAMAPALSVKPPPPATLVAAGECPMFLAYWASEEATDAATKLIDPFGVTPTPVWIKGQAGKSDPNSWTTTRNYVGRLVWKTGPVNGGDTTRAPIERAEDLDWLRTTHWFWRFLALSRNVESFRRRQWNMARLRLRDILSYRIDPRDRPDQPAGAKQVPLDKIFTSEAAVALLLRCHIRKSQFVAHERFRLPSVRLALAFAAIEEANPAKWTSVEERRLIDGLIAAAAFSSLPPAERKRLQGLPPAKLGEHRERLAALQTNKAGLLADCRNILAWPAETKFRWGTQKPKRGQFELEAAAAKPKLRHDRDSFKFDDSGLPPKP